MAAQNREKFSLSAKGIDVSLDLSVGHIEKFVVSMGDRTIAPFHRAPWADDASVQRSDGFPPHLKRLSIDFLCAPFGGSDVEPAPDHGWSANAEWIPFGLEEFGDGKTASFELCRKILGARVVKKLTVRDGHPFLYQSHHFSGGSGTLPIAYHAMVDLPRGGAISVSPKTLARTADGPLESEPLKGSSLLSYPAASERLDRFPTGNGAHVDLLAYPLGEDHVDLVMLLERQDNEIGWTVAARPSEGDMAIVLKSPKELPTTIFWYSNGGRRYQPWNGRHRGVLGIEEARTYFSAGHAASQMPNDLSSAGYPTTFSLGGEVRIRSVLGACPVFGHSTKYRSVDRSGGHLRVVNDDGSSMELPFDCAFLD
ncbi:hypothetical protein RFM26_08285 [Mesorhizobium sp. VK23B]|uniref:DUF4432 domain-containing protein n=1 Tax=Mesorhizobium dulcispinae TaxID=3072316 RepID=A0ABU4X9Q2_9HYPH|nr:MULTISPECIES: hypothetical protein [unclassified Mesorhizobium]MDX8465678.1 hypothetical protein [Mesorhizobium sp. VK23B]MDX8471520.1 hypothetical protein [Mesorhizobium sp. VK23A]